MSKSAKLELNGKTLECPVIEGSEGEVAVDIGQLRSETGAITLDPGFVNTGSCLSSITFLNGEKGLLKYRGLTIEKLCEKSHFLEVAYLLIYGALPREAELKHFESQINEQAQLPAGIFDLIRSFPRDAHPMAVLSSATVALSGFYPEYNAPILNDKQKDKVMTQMLAQLPVIAAAFYQHSRGQEIAPWDASLDYAHNFLNMMFHGEGEKSVNDDVARALDVLFILHADHEQNCSTSTVRVVGSGQANLFASITAGINALWGPLHGGANQAVIEMLDQIQAAGGDTQKFLAKAKDKEDPFRLMGFGHRVYKNFDPRARIIKSYCDKVLSTLGVVDPVLDIAKSLEAEALKDPYFKDRKLYPNVDFYSGIIYRALGIPTNFFTVMFALGRLPGWMAQWKEMVENPKARISRPRQIYTGPVETPWVDLKDRG